MDHSTIENIFTIWIADVSGNQMPTVLNIQLWIQLIKNLFSCSSKQSETSRSNRSTPVKKATRLVSYIDPDEEEDPDKTIKDEEVEGGNQDMEFDKSDEQLGNCLGLIL